MATLGNRRKLTIPRDLVDTLEGRLDKGVVRLPNNPLLGPNGSPETNRAMFNVSMEDYGGRILGLARCFGEDETTTRLGRNEGISRFFLADFGPDGTKLNTVSANAVFAPDINKGEIDFEDARTTYLDGKYYVTYTVTTMGSLRGEPVLVWKPALAVTTDFHTFTRIGISGLPLFSKDLVLFPEKFDGRYVAYFRPTVPMEEAY